MAAKIMVSGFSVTGFGPLGMRLRSIELRRDKPAWQAGVSLQVQSFNVQRLMG